MSDSLLPTAPAMDEPLEMLQACHGRIEAQLRTLERLLAHLSEHGADQQAAQAARAIIRYFDTAGQHHHEDEEIDLFPMLMQRASGADYATLTALVDRLLTDHAAMFEAWSSVRKQLQPTAEGIGAALESDSVQRLACRYRSHIEIENRDLLRISRRLLCAQDLEVLSRAMTARRSHGR